MCYNIQQWILDSHGSCPFTGDEISVYNENAHRTSILGCGFVVVHYTSWQPPVFTTIPANKILKGFTAHTQLLLSFTKTGVHALLRKCLLSHPLYKLSRTLNVDYKKEVVHVVWWSKTNTGWHIEQVCDFLYTNQVWSSRQLGY